MSLSVSQQLDLCAVIQLAGRLEKKAEVVRQLLCEHAEFVPFTAFKCLDARSFNRVCADDIQSFLTAHKSSISLSSCAFFVKLFDRDGDGELSFDEFLDVILPQDSESLCERVLARESKVATFYDTDIEIKYTLTKLIEWQMNGLTELEGEKQVLFGYASTSKAQLLEECFSCIDIEGRGFLTPRQVETFFESNAILISADEIEAFFRRSSCDKRMDMLCKADFIRAIDQDEYFNELIVDNNHEQPAINKVELSTAKGILKASSVQNSPVPLKYATANGKSPQKSILKPTHQQQQQLSNSKRVSYQPYDKENLGENAGIRGSDDDYHYHDEDKLERQAQQDDRDDHYLVVNASVAANDIGRRRVEEDIQRGRLIRDLSNSKLLAQEDHSYSNQSTQKNSYYGVSPNRYTKGEQPSQTSSTSSQGEMFAKRLSRGRLATRQGVLSFKQEIRGQLAYSKVRNSISPMKTVAAVLSMSTTLPKKARGNSSVRMRQLYEVTTKIAKKKRQASRSASSSRNSSVIANSSNNHSVTTRGISNLPIAQKQQLRRLNPNAAKEPPAERNLRQNIAFHLQNYLLCVIESAKRSQQIKAELIHRYDFNFFQLFELLDRQSRGCVSAYDVYLFLVGQSVEVKMSDIELFVRRMDTMDIGVVKFSTFAEKVRESGKKNNSNNKNINQYEEQQFMQASSNMVISRHTIELFNSLMTEFITAEKNLEVIRQEILREKKWDYQLAFQLLRGHESSGRQYNQPQIVHRKDIENFLANQANYLASKHDMDSIMEVFDAQYGASVQIDAFIMEMQPRQSIRQDHLHHDLL